MLRHFRMLAAYNRWANAQVYTAAAELSEAEFRSDSGAFFGSLHRTLNHLLVADRIWMKRFTGIGDAPVTLDAVLFEELDALAAARKAFRFGDSLRSGLDNRSDNLVDLGVEVFVVNHPRDQP